MSLTIRLRFSHQRWRAPRAPGHAACSLRLACFSAAVSSPPRGFFLRLAGLLHRRLIPLERCVLIHGWSQADRRQLLPSSAIRLSWVLPGYVPLRNRTCPSTAPGHPARSCPCAFSSCRCSRGPGFSGVFGRCRRLCLPSMMTTCWPLGWTGLLAKLDGHRGSGRDSSQVIQGRAQYREKVMQPIIRLRGTDAEELLPAPPAAGTSSGRTRTNSSLSAPLERASVASAQPPASRWRG